MSKQSSSSSTWSTHCAVVDERRRRGHVHRLLLLAACCARLRRCSEALHGGHRPACDAASELFSCEWPPRARGRWWKPESMQMFTCPDASLPCVGRPLLLPALKPAVLRRCDRGTCASRAGYRASEAAAWPSWSLEAPGGSRVVRPSAMDRTSSFTSWASQKRRSGAHSATLAATPAERNTVFVGHDAKRSSSTATVSLRRRRANRLTVSAFSQETWLVARWQIRS